MRKLLSILGVFILLFGVLGGCASSKNTEENKKIAAEKMKERADARDEEFETDYYFATSSSASKLDELLREEGQTALNDFSDKLSKASKIKAEIAGSSVILTNKGQIGELATELASILPNSVGIFQTVLKEGSKFTMNSETGEKFIVDKNFIDITSDGNRVKITIL